MFIRVNAGILPEVIILTGVGDWGKLGDIRDKKLRDRTA